MARLQCAHRPIHRAIFEHIAVPEVLGKALIIDAAIDVRACEHRLDLRTEGEVTIDPGVVKRLNAESVAHQNHAPPFRIPQGKGEYSLEACQPFETPGIVGMQDDFSIRVSAEYATGAFELAAQIAKVVDRK